MEVESYSVLKQLRRNLLLPYVLLVIVTIAIDGVLYFSAKRLNDFSKESSAHLFSSVIKHEQSSLSRITRDYSFWYETVEKLTVQFDPVWVVSNLQVYLRDNFSITTVFVIKQDLSIFLSVKESGVEQNPQGYVLSKGMMALLQQAKESDLDNPQPAIGTAMIDGEVNLVAVSPLTPDVEVNGLDVGKSYGLLVFAKRLESLLPTWSDDFEFGKISLHAMAPKADQDFVPVEIRSPTGEMIAIVALHPKLPGDDFISDTLPWVTVFALFALVLSLYFIYRVNRLSRAADQVVSDLHNGESEFRLAQQKLQHVIDGAHLGYWDWNYQTGEHQVNDRWLEIIGLERSELKNHIDDWLDRVHPDDKEHVLNTIDMNIMLKNNYSCEFRIQHKDGHWVWVESAGAVVEYEGDKPSRLSGIYQDISERKSFEAWLEQQATHDHLTGLLNRGEMQRLADKELDRATRYNHRLSLFMVDIDHFKRVNDEFGHQMGDEVLKTIAQVLGDVSRQIDIVARFGGEEFVLLLPETPEQKAKEMADRLRREVSRTEITDGFQELRVTVSIGIATFPQDGADFKALLGQADRALYEAKDSGRNCVWHIQDVGKTHQSQTKAD